MTETKKNSMDCGTGNKNRQKKKELELDPLVDSNPCATGPEANTLQADPSIS